MIRYECDLCHGEMRGSSDLAARRPYEGHVVKPGYVGEKMLCKACYVKWTDAVVAFFGGVLQ